MVVWPAIILMSALSTAGAAHSAGADGARFPRSPQYPLLPRARDRAGADRGAEAPARPGNGLGSRHERTRHQGGRAAMPSRAWSAAAPASCGPCWDAARTRSLLPG